MGSFESGLGPKQIKSGEETTSESLKYREVAEDCGAEQEAELKPEQALAQERGVLERFKGKAKQVVGVLLFVSALSAGSGLVSETYAQEAEPATQIEQAQKQEERGEKINEANLTESSKWARDIINSAQAEMEKIETAEDAEWLLRTYFNQFVYEYYMPTKGNLKEGSYGLATRDYTEDDIKLLFKSALDMKGIVHNLNYKFKIKAFDKRMEQIDDVIIKLGKKSFYSGQKQKMAVERMEKRIEEILQQR